MTASSAPPAEQTRLRPRSKARREGLRPILVARSISPTPVRPNSAPATGPQGRAECQAARRLERRQRRLVAALGLLVLAGMLVITVIVLDLLH